MLTAIVVAETAALVLLGLLVAGLLRSHAEILRALDQLGAGLGDDDGEDRGFRVREDLPAPRQGFAAASDLAGVAPGDEAVAVGVVAVEHPTLLAFLSSGCLTCATFWEAFADPRGLGLPTGTRLVVVTKDPSEESESGIAELAPAGVPLVMSSAAWEAYEVPGSPYFVAVDGPSGRVTGEGTATTWEQVARLLGSAAADAGVRRTGRTRRGGRGAARDGDAAREARADRELLAAGIGPGHPSLYPAAEADGEEGVAR